MSARTEGRERLRDRRGSWRVIRHLMVVRPVSYWVGSLLWWLVIISPLAVGLLLEQLFDAVAGDGPALALLAAVAGIEVMRVLVLPLTAWVFEPFWGTSETVLRTNLLRAQLAADHRERGPAITDAAAALPLFREDPEYLTRAADHWIDLVGQLVLAVIALAVIARIGPGVALAVAAPLVAAMAVGHLLAPMVRRRRAADRAVTAEVTGFLGEVFGAVTTITTSAAAPAVLRRLAALCERRRVTAVRDRVAEQLMPTVGIAAGDLALAGGLLAVALLAADDLTAGQVALLASYAVLLAGLPRNWAEWLAVRRHADVAVDRLRGAVRDGEVARLITPVARVELDPAPVPRHAVPDRPGPPRLELDGVVAVAPDGTHIGPVDLAVPSGGMAVISGVVGSGKSTLLRALLGLLPLAAGTIRWDGQVVEPRTSMVPPRAAYVAQVPTLFSERLDDNLRLGWDVDDERLRAVLTAVAASDLADGLEDGLATRLGPRGVRLSGGQAHRVAAARALVADAALVVADDLSAALDADTESRLLDRLVDGRRTLLVVSHRPAVHARADVLHELRR